MRKKHLMPYNLQYFAEPVTDAAALDTLLESMGETTPPETPPVDAPPDAVPPVDTPPVDTPPTEPPKPSKQEFAFSEMRVQNSQLLNTITKLAQATGIEYKDTNDLMAKINSDALVKLAATQKVPVELLQRMETLETQNGAYLAEQLKRDSFQSFQKIKTDYALTDDELSGFAKELDALGKNPFTTKMDIEAEYKAIHFDEIQNKRIAAAVEAALKKSSAADTHSSTPNSAGGQPGTTPGEDKISTVSGLNTFLEGMKK